jgi:hypothetical protein
MEEREPRGSRTPAVLTAVVILAVITPVVARVSATRGQTGAEVEGPWTPHVRAVDRAVAQDSATGAVQAWYEAHGAALRSQRWEGLLAVGDAGLRIATMPRLSRAFEAKARQVYLLTLFRARDQASIDGVLRTAEAFATLGDRAVVEQALQVADQLAARAGDPEGRERLRAVGALLRDRLLAAERQP